MSETIPQKQQNIIEEFEFFDDWLDKYQLIIEKGQNLPEFDNVFKTDQYLIRGCQSQVWFYMIPSENPDNQNQTLLNFYAKSDAAIVNGLLALLVSVYSGHTAEDIIQSNSDFLDKIGLTQHLSPTRNNGLYSVLSKIQSLAQSAS